MHHGHLPRAGGVLEVFVMALFGKDGERSEWARGFGVENVVSAGGRAPREAEMFERDKPRVEPEQGGSPNAFLGQGSWVAGKLVFEGPVRIEGYVEGEITAQDTLTIGESAVVNA